MRKELLQPLHRIGIQCESVLDYELEVVAVYSLPVADVVT